jgi:hypothetical protein
LGHSQGSQEVLVRSLWQIVIYLHRRSSRQYIYEHRKREGIGHPSLLHFVEQTVNHPLCWSAAKFCRFRKIFLQHFPLPQEILSMERPFGATILVLDR